jgi:hypothetical protein
MTTAESVGGPVGFPTEIKYRMGVKNKDVGAILNSTLLSIKLTLDDVVD